MSADHADGGTAMREQVFLKVAFDFEYIADDHKKIFIKEDEVLMLIAKTNHDWWQVRLTRKPIKTSNDVYSRAQIRGAFSTDLPSFVTASSKQQESVFTHALALVKVGKSAVGH